MAAEQEILASIYYNLEGKPAAFTNSVQSLLREARRQNPAITAKTVRRFLNDSFVYLKHKNVHKKRQPTLPIITTNVGLLTDCDLMFMKGSRNIGGVMFPCILVVLQALLKPHVSFLGTLC